MANSAFFDDGIEPKTRTFFIPTLVTPSEYPSEKLKDKEKPKINISFTSHTPYKQLATKIKLDLEAGRFELEDAKAFVLLYAKEHVTLKLQDKWESFGIDIGAANETISIDSILAVEHEDGRLDKMTESSDAICENLFVFLLATFRIYPLIDRQENSGYLTILTTKIKDQFHFESQIVQILGMWKDAAKICNDGHFFALVAAVDMLLLKKGSADTSGYRVCTLTAFFHDCAGINLLKYFASKLGQKEGDALLYIFHKDAATELMKMLSETEELERLDSYTPYCRSMGIVAKSPWSISQCPNLFTYVTAYGAAAGDSRGLNAVMQSNVAENVIYPIVMINSL